MKIYIVAIAAAAFAALGDAQVETPAMRQVDGVDTGIASRELAGWDRKRPCTKFNNWCNMKPLAQAPEPAPQSVEETAARNLAAQIRPNPKLPCTRSNNWCGMKPWLSAPEPVVVAQAPVPVMNESSN